MDFLYQYIKNQGIFGSARSKNYIAIKNIFCKLGEQLNTQTDIYKWTYKHIRVYIYVYIYIVYIYI